MLGHRDLTRRLASEEATKMERRGAALRGGECQIKRGLVMSENARNEIVQSNLRLVLFIARRYANRNLPMRDLIQEGSLGLLHAADRFDFRRGTRFATYAGWWIYTRIGRAVGSMSAMIRIPAYAADMRRRVNLARTRLLGSDGVMPTDEEIAEKLGITARHIERSAHTVAEPVGLSTPDGSESPREGAIGANLLFEELH